MPVLSYQTVVVHHWRYGISYAEQSVLQTGTPHDIALPHTGECSVPVTVAVAEHRIAGQAAFEVTIPLLGCPICTRRFTGPEQQRVRDAAIEAHLRIPVYEPDDVPAAAIRRTPIDVILDL